MVSRTRDGAIGPEIVDAGPFTNPAKATGPIGLLAAVRWEVHPWLRGRSGVRKNGPVHSLTIHGLPVHVTVAGVGAENACREAHRMVDQFRVAGLVSIGFAGGLADFLRPGDIVSANCVVDQSTGERFECSPNLWPLETGYQGGLLCAAEVICSAEEKRSLAGQWGAVAVDMESAGVARAAAERGVAFAALKAVTDTSSQSISIDFAHCRSEDNELSFWKIIREGVRTSQTIRDFWMLARGARVASRALAAALDSPELRVTR